MEDLPKEQVRLAGAASNLRNNVDEMMKETVRTRERLNQMSDVLDGLYEAAKLAFPEAYENHLKKKESEEA